MKLIDLATVLDSNIEMIIIRSIDGDLIYKEIASDIRNRQDALRFTVIRFQPLNDQQVLIVI